MIYGVGFEAGAGAGGDAESLAVRKENAHVSNVLSVTHDASLCSLLLSKHHEPLRYVVDSFQHRRVETKCIPAPPFKKQKTVLSIFSIVLSYKTSATSFYLINKTRMYRDETI